MLQDRLLEALLMLIPSGLLTTLIYLYLNAGKPIKQVLGHVTRTNFWPKVDNQMT